YWPSHHEASHSSPTRRSSDLLAAARGRFGGPGAPAARTAGGGGAADAPRRRHRLQYLQHGAGGDHGSSGVFPGGPPGVRTRGAAAGRGAGGGRVLVPASPRHGRLFHRAAAAAALTVLRVVLRRGATKVFVGKGFGE